MNFHEFRRFSDIYSRLQTPPKNHFINNIKVLHFNGIDFSFVSQFPWTTVSLWFFFAHYSVLLPTTTTRIRKNHFYLSTCRFRPLLFSYILVAFSCLRIQKQTIQHATVDGCAKIKNSIKMEKLCNKLSKRFVYLMWTDVPLPSSLSSFSSFCESVQALV